MTECVKLNETDVAIFTFSNRVAVCPCCAAAHEITQKMEYKAFETKRGYPVIKCGCGAKLAAFSCAISRRWVLEICHTQKELDKLWKAGRLLNGVEHNEYPINHSL